MLYQVQLESQSRPMYSSYQKAGLRRGTHVIVRQENGECYGMILDARSFAQGCIPHHLVLPILRVASEDDRKTRERHVSLEKEAFRHCQDRADQLKLNMKLVDVNMTFDESRLTYLYTAESRVAFRELVRELAHRYRIRIEMRQVGVRDEAKLRGGYGHCGRPLCCTAHLRQFYPITVKMAKEQELSLNPSKISGLCGRLMCCLRYECPSRLKHSRRGPSSE